MLKKVKDWLGIEGVKLQLILPETIKESDGEIRGIIRLFSMKSAKISYIRVSMTERYARGRKQDRLIDEYKVGMIEFKETLTIPKEQELDIEFTLPYQLTRSEMDDIADSGLLMSGLVKLAKIFEKVESEYFIQAEAKVMGTGLDPFDKQLVNLE